MKRKPWTRVSPRKRLGELRGNPVLIYHGDAGVVLTYQRSNRREGTITWAWAHALDSPHRESERPTTQLRKVGQQRLGHHILKPSIIILPGVRWAFPENGPWGALTPARWKHTEVLSPTAERLTGTDLIDYAQARLTGGSVAPPDSRREEAQAAVDEIKAEFGRISADVVYRIVYPALFDTAVPATAAFHTAVMLFDDAPDDALAGQLERLAAEVEISYSVAKRHAETIKHRHLPSSARRDARRAAKAARLARNAATEGERTASLNQVRRILDSLALYYLPQLNPTTLAIEAPQEPGAEPAAD